MYHYQGECRCGSATLDLSLPKPLSEYSPRACDCSFCTRRGAAYLSDPAGQLTVTFAAEPPQVRQGSDQAVFLLCPNCERLICGVIADGDGYIGAINCQASAMFDVTLPSTPASPQQLSATETLTRWRQVWFPVMLNPPLMLAQSAYEHQAPISVNPTTKVRCDRDD
ncbi:hypothetical protein BST95_16415 [Halioglobus japonicus]|uniref:Aldehyde-activating protein n=1 Tax=Halioglobus japonicus TaxID=930805 RepID=A0AAP8MGJ6_9GAMM|nr:hypothetical protein [Halioglobus japonicus]AQA19583.1 hypothetical protein BST95_16415 [Halioglobus japonicus]PLW87350.1 aldehyde-activating protein [Halioglobus japonicus]GHD08915.1 hypothetical protein GCM10007052_06400 [Halioglobus japonicus]